jgi:hypothetical protein
MLEHAMSCAQQRNVLQNQLEYKGRVGVEVTAPLSIGVTGHAGTELLDRGHLPQTNTFVGLFATMRTTYDSVRPCVLSSRRADTIFMKAFIYNLSAL